MLDELRRALALTFINWAASVHPLKTREDHVFHTGLLSLLNAVIAAQKQAP